MNDLGIFSSLLVSLLEFASKEEHYQNWAFPPGLTNNKSAGKDPITTLDTLGRLTKLFTLDPFLLWNSGTDEVGDVEHGTFRNQEQGLLDFLWIVLKCKIETAI